MGYTLGLLAERIGARLKSWGQKKMMEVKPASIFLQPHALSLNEARLKHLDSLGFDFKGKRILEVGAGIGLLTSFFEKRGAIIVSTEGREENVREMRRIFPHRRIERLDLDQENNISRLGNFDIIFCYGTLYHLARPEQALKTLAAVSNSILLESCVTPGRHSDPHLVKESASFDQALNQVGSRPTRPWIMEQLKKYWGYSYQSKFQPAHKDFELDWRLPAKHGNHRAVFVGSKKPLRNPGLLENLPDKQERYVETKYQE